MAAKKFYGVRKGKKTGIFNSWDACKTAVDGFPGAEYKGFVTLEEAQAYMGMPLTEGMKPEKESIIFLEGIQPEGSVSSKEHQKADIPQKGVLLAYVDGSYDDSIKKYAFGCVFILADGRIFIEYGNGDNPQSLQHRNVTGEMLGAMYAVKVAMMNGYREIEIRYDYQGIEKWVTGEWRSKTELTQKYTQAMRGWMQDIRITFTKVPAHSNVKYNEVADLTAKRGLTEGTGVPKVKLFEEMEQYGTNSIE